MQIKCRYKEIYLYYLSTFEFLKTPRKPSIFTLEPTSEWECTPIYDIKEKLKFKDIENCFKSLGFILDALERINKMLLKIDLEDIYCFFKNDEYYFVIVNFENLYNIDHDKTISINTPFKKTVLISKVLQNVDTLPTSIPYNQIYYNLDL